MSKLISINEGDLKSMVDKVVSEVTRRRSMLKEDSSKSYTAIGFATKFYTLWTVTETVETNESGVYEKTYCTYLRNISMNLDRAKEKYPDAVFVPDLRGHTSFCRTKCVEKYGEDEFKGGKYVGQKIADCKDYNYLLWAWDKYPYVISYGARDLVEAILDSAGYKKINDSKIVTPEEYAKIEASFTECEEVAAKFKEGPVTVLFTRNLDEYGNTTVGNITYHFENVKDMYYQGYTYCLPVDSKGKAKKIKGKELTLMADDCQMEVNEYGWGATLTVHVKDFVVN